MVHKAEKQDIINEAADEAASATINEHELSESKYKYYSFCNVLFVFKCDVYQNRELNH